MGSKKQRNGTTRARLEREERERRIARHRTRGRRRMLFDGATILLAAAIVTVVVALGDSASSKPPYAGTTIDVSLGDFTITGNLTAPAGKVRLHAVDNGGATTTSGCAVVRSPRTCSRERTRRSTWARSQRERTS